MHERNTIKLHVQVFLRMNTLYTFTHITVLIPTYSVWYVILFQETGVVHRITHIFSYFLLFIY